MEQFQQLLHNIPTSLDRSFWIIPFVMWFGGLVDRARGGGHDFINALPGRQLWWSSLSWLLLLIMIVPDFRVTLIWVAGYAFWANWPWGKFHNVGTREQIFQHWLRMWCALPWMAGLWYYTEHWVYLAGVFLLPTLLTGMQIFFRRYFYQTGNFIMPLEVHRGMVFGLLTLPIANGG